MKKFSLLSATMALVLMPISVTLVQAQYKVDRDPGTSAEKPTSKGGRKAKPSPVTQEVPLFPQAKREAPKQSGTPAMSKQLVALFELKEKHSYDQAIAGADAILSDRRASGYDKSMAGYVAGYSWLEKAPEQRADARRYLLGALNDNGLSNNSHYQIMLQVSQMLKDEDKHAQALGMVDRYLTESGSEDPRALGLKAHMLFELKRYDDSAKVFEDQLARKPGDKKIMLNLVNTHVQNGQEAKAVEVFGRMRKLGLMTESKDYEVAYGLLAQIDGREQEAIAMINEGLEKGILTPSYAVYAFQGHVYYQGDQIAKAIEAWARAAPLSKDGETYLNLGKLLADEERWADAKAAAKSAMAKGVKKQGEVWRLIARAEAGLGNKSAAIAATRESAKFPETTKWAEAELRQTFGK